MSYYVQEFKNIQDILDQYQAPKGALDGAVVHLAWYGYGSYEGSSWVLFEKDGKLYEVHGSHCSCYGLEGQWEPEETSWKAIAMRKVAEDLPISDHEFYDGEKAAYAALGELLKEHAA